jgi:hypothetical protein
MDTKTFIRHVQQQASDRRLSFKVDLQRGKGSHRMVFVGNRRCTIPWRVDSIPLGTRRRILKVLGLDPHLLR